MQHISNKIALQCNFSSFIIKKIHNLRKVVYENRGQELYYCTLRGEISQIDVCVVVIRKGVGNQLQHAIKSWIFRCYVDDQNPCE